MESSLQPPIDSDMSEVAASLVIGVDELQTQEKAHLEIVARLHAFKQQVAMGMVSGSSAGTAKSSAETRADLKHRVRALDAQRSSVRQRVEEALDELRSEGAEVLMAFDYDEDDDEDEDSVEFGPIGSQAQTQMAMRTIEISAGAGAGAGTGTVGTAAGGDDANDHGDTDMDET